MREKNSEPRLAVFLRDFYRKFIVLEKSIGYPMFSFGA